MIVPCSAAVTITTVSTWTFVARRVLCVRVVRPAALGRSCPASNRKVRRLAPMTTIIPATLTPPPLAEEVRKLAATPREWMARVRLGTEGRWYERIHVDGQYEVWLISWLPGQATGFHDHGGSAGALCGGFGTPGGDPGGTPQP